ncbi:ribosomal protein L1/ribosomal biogenesis protein, partial [Hysterangium stoloniferum]
MAISSNSSKSPTLIDDHVSLEQCKKAVTALLKHVRAEQEKEDETQLLPGKEQHVWLVMTVKRMQPQKNLKPQKIPLAHPLVDPRTTSVCLITKDPQREYKDLLESHNIKFISRVVGMEKLKGKFKGFDARRLLLRENGLFLADDRVLPLLPRLLGKEWFKAKKQPIPVSMTKKDLKGELEKAISSTYMHQNQGTCTSIKIANISHKDSQVLANLQAAIPAVVKRIHEGWENVQNLLIKTSNSVSLPIWTCPLGSDEPGSRWAGMTVED